MLVNHEGFMFNTGYGWFVHAYELNLGRLSVHSSNFSFSTVLKLSRGLGILKSNLKKRMLYLLFVHDVSSHRVVRLH